MNYYEVDVFFRDNHCGCFTVQETSKTSAVKLVKNNFNFIVSDIEENNNNKRVDCWLTSEDESKIQVTFDLYAINDYQASEIVRSGVRFRARLIR